MALLVGITVYLVIINVVTFALYGADKRRARKGAWRISERTLLLLALFGGALGAFAGMRHFRHKTRKLAFRVVVPVLMALQVAAYALFLALNVYAADYYRADARAVDALQSDDVVNVDETGYGYLFDGPGEDAALVFYPGAKVETQAYAPLMREIASEGVDCVLVDMPYHLAIFGIGRADWAMDDFDYDRWYVGGHSLGGAMAASYAAGHLDNLDGIVLLASYSTEDLHAAGFSSLSVYGSNDGVLNRETYAEDAANLPDDSSEVVIEGGNHAQFGDYGAQAGDGEAEITPEEQQAQTAQAVVETILEP